MRRCHLNAIMQVGRQCVLFMAVAATCLITTYVGFTWKPGLDGPPHPGQPATIPAAFHNIVPNVLSNLQRTQRTLQEQQHGGPEDGATHFALIEDIPDVHVKSVSCEKLFVGDSNEQQLAKNYHKGHPKVKVTATEYIRMTANCITFTQQRKYLMNPGSEEEENFPLAYSILMFKDVEQTERLLRAIYQPQNYYCIHIDSKSDKDIHKAMSAIAKCFSNVFIASRSVPVHWATFSVLQPELICMRDLWRYTKWRYFINLTGQEWPLKTNGDLVKILRAYNGGNDVEGSVKRSDPERYKYSYFDMTVGEPKAPLKLDITLTKGSVHIAVQRGFVDYVLHNPIATKFKQWVNDTWIPDETYFSSLNHSPQLNVPGAYLGDPETHPLMKPFLTRFKNWGMWPFDFPCGGRWVKQICVLGVGDLPLLKKRKEMFANKFYLDFEPLALDCMEELHWSKVRGEISGQRHFNSSYYAHLSFAKYHLN